MVTTWQHEYRNDNNFLRRFLMGRIMSKLLKIITIVRWHVLALPCLILLLSTNSVAQNRQFIFWDLLSPEIQALYLENPSVDPEVKSFLNGTAPADPRAFGDKLVSGDAKLLPLYFNVFNLLLKSELLNTDYLGVLCFRMIKNDPEYVFAYFNYDRIAKQNTDKVKLYLTYAYYVGFELQFVPYKISPIEQTIEAFSAELKSKLANSSAEIKETLDAFLTVTFTIYGADQDDLKDLDIQGSSQNMDDFIRKNGGTGLREIEQGQGTNTNTKPPDNTGGTGGTGTQPVEEEADIHVVVESQPTPIGGDAAFYKFINKNIRYPNGAISKRIQGKVTIQFVVEPDGSLTNFKVLKGIGGGCDEEAVRVLQKAPRWIPGKLGGEAVRTYVTRPIIFRIRG